MLAVTSAKMIRSFSPAATRRGAPQPEKHLALVNLKLSPSGKALDVVCGSSSEPTT